MLHPSTPSKAHDGIERIKLSLSQKWGIAFPPRDVNWSPSRRDPNRIEDKISARIQFLYYQEGALASAIDEFEKNAVTIHSDWRYKPRAESNVLPSREPSESALRQNFLHKRDPLEEGAVKLLSQNLLLCLDRMTDRVRSGETIQLVEAKKAGKTVSVGRTPRSDHRRLQQSSIKQWCRSRSEPGASSDGPMAAGGHHSSDDFKDDGMANILNEMSKHDHMSGPIDLDYQKKLGTTTPEDEEYETPPTTPPPSKKDTVGLGIGLDEQTRHSTIIHPPKPELGTIYNKKRPHSGAEPMKPPPTRRVSREKSNIQSHSTFAVPTPPPDGYGFTSRSLSMSHSFDSISVTSSMTSASTAWTSPNTSFCSESVATSFGSNPDETDNMMPPPLGRSRPRYSHDPSSLRYPGKAKENRKNRSSRSFGQDSQAQNASSKQCEPGNTITESSGAIDVNMVDMALSAEGINAAAKSSTIDELEKHLLSQSPFVALDDDVAAIPFRQLYETIRVSSHGKLSKVKTSYLLGQTYESYDALWTSLCRVARESKAQVPEKSSPAAWERAQQNFDGVAISGKLTFSEQPNGPLFEFKLNPLRLESSYRFSRKFGGDRFCVITIPGLGSTNMPAYLRADHVAARDCIIKWLVDTQHHFLGRKWHVFYIKPDASKRRQKSSHTTSDDAKYRIYFFAEDGVGFKSQSYKGEPDPRNPIRRTTTVDKLIEWFMDLKINRDQPSLKLFARLALGVSDTIPTVVFTSQEIIRCDDARADSAKTWRLNVARSDEKKSGCKLPETNAPVMNDGCSRISRKAATAIAEMLGLDHTPSVYQGRIGGAKGIWMVDSLDENPFKQSLNSRNFWIEINDSQLKFESHAVDAIYPDDERVKFEVNDYSRRLAPTALKFQLMPILADRGVPIEVFRNRLEEDLTLRVSELKVAMDNSLSLRKWNQDTNPVSGDRARYGGIEMQGGLPLARAEKINWFLEHGFEAKSCYYLKQQLWESILSYCLRLENKMNIGLGCSTYAFMIADPLAILEENEVHLGFSNSFRDTKSGFDETMLHDLDVLVARLPAHLPSDVQKVRAIFRPELRAYRDVIVFPSKGSISLASKLSGGDYDGDKAWICWDTDIVKPFNNATVPEFPSHEFYGIEKDSTKVADHLAHPDYVKRFLRQAFDFNLQLNMLGPCTNYHEALCYKRNSIDTPEAINIAVLLGDLVDSAKGGFIFDDAKWTAFLRKNDLPLRLQPPAYKDKDRAKPTDHMIDQLVFDIAKKVREEALGDFDARFTDASWWDADLVRHRKELLKHTPSDVSLALVLKNLEADLEDILRFWTTNARPDDENDETRPARKGHALSFRAVVGKCREDFLSLRPRTDDPSLRSTQRDLETDTTEMTSAVDVSERVRQWQQEYQNGSNNSQWALVKASVAFHHHHKRAFVWYIAGTELGEIKATSKGRGTYRISTNEIFDNFKLDSKLVDGAKRREMERQAEVDGTFDDLGALADDEALLENIDWDEGMSQL